MRSSKYVSRPMAVIRNANNPYNPYLQAYTCPDCGRSNEEAKTLKSIHDRGAVYATVKCPCGCTYDYLD